MVVMAGLTPVGATAVTPRSLDGKSVVVTGGASGLGKVIACAFADAGAKVAVTSRSANDLAAVVDEIQSTGGQVLPITMDLRQRHTIDVAMKLAIDGLGGIDVLVCNSGIAGPSAPIHEVTDDDWDDTIEVNLTGTFLCARAAARAMVPAQSGSIVLIGSMTGKRPLLNRSPYAASKMALVGLARTMAWDLGSHGIRVNSVSPGFIEGQRLDWVVDAQAQAQARSPEDIRAGMESASPLSRVTSPEDVARAVVFLGSEQSAGITGEDLNVSSGLVMYG